MSAEPSQSVNPAVAALQRAFEADPAALHALCCNRVPCNKALADDEHIVVEPSRVLEEACTVGALGLVNGVLAACGLPLVAMQFDQRDDGIVLKGFCEFRPADPGT